MSIAEKLTTIAENQEKVFEAGKKAEYDRFWDEFQDYGNRTQYSYAFCYGGWNDETYNPKYTIRPTSCNNLFASSSAITDTKVAIDLTHPGGNQKFGLFKGAAKLTTIRKLIVNESTIFTTSAGQNSFSGCSKLENITFEGTIGKSIDFSDCPLSVESMVNVITNLAHYRGTENEYKYTVTFNDSCWEALENSDYDVNEFIPDVTSWSDGVGYKGWNI